MQSGGIIAHYLLLGAVLAAPVVAAAAPWDSACTDVAGAGAGAQDAQHDVQERYERFQP